MPGGFPHRSMGFAAFVVIGVAALLLASLLHGSVVLLVALAVAVPIVIVLVVRSAARRRSRVRPSR